MRFFIKNNRDAGLKSRLSGMLGRGLLIAAMAFSTSTGFSRQAPDSVAAEPLTARVAFTELQSPALEILKRTTRLDMLDYWDADSIYKAKNAVMGLSWIETLSPDYIKVRLSEVSFCEIKLLPEKNGRIVMTIYTVGDSVQAPDSQVDFYDTSLRPLDRKKYFKAPDLKDFFEIPKGSMTSMKEIREMVPFPTVEYSANAENNSISARLTVGEFMNLDDYNIVKLFLKPEITLEWKGKYKVKGK